MRGSLDSINRDRRRRGPPTLVQMQNNLARGVRMASDFLMGCKVRAPIERTR